MGITGEKPSLEQREQTYVAQLEAVRKSLNEKAAAVFRESRKNQSSKGNWIDEAAKEVVTALLQDSDSIASLVGFGNELMKERAEVYFKAAQKREKEGVKV